MISPSHQHTIGIGEYGSIYVPDFISRAFLFEEDDATNAIYTIGLGDAGTLDIPAIVHNVDDTASIPKDSFTVGLGSEGTVEFPGFMTDYFSKSNIFTIGLGDMGTVTIGDSSDMNAEVVKLKNHRTIGLGNVGTVYIDHEAAKAPVYLSFDMPGMGTTAVKGYLDRNMKNPPKDPNLAYSIGCGAMGTLYFPKSVGGLLDLARHDNELKDHNTIGLGDYGSVQIGVEVARAPVRYSIGIGSHGNANVNGYLDRSMKNPPKDGANTYSIGLGDRGTLYFPKFVGKAFDVAKYGIGVLSVGLGKYGTLKLSQDRSLQHFILDDECYLGKHGDASECVDFDPLHNFL